jgi:hypothetical protein
MADFTCPKARKTNTWVTSVPNWTVLKWRFENIITYLTHPITNATSESIKQNFINAIYFHCGGLDLAPGTH